MKTLNEFMVKECEEFPILELFSNGCVGRCPRKKKLTKGTVTDHPSTLQEFKAEIIEILIVECNLSLQNHCSILDPEGSAGDIFQEGLYGKSE